ncbi:recombination mediator RecR [Megalodesulfovibrio paquesii]
MSSTLPGPLQVLVTELASLPGLGPKSALRLALTLLKWPEARTRNLGTAIHELRDRLAICSRCGGLADRDPCELCSDARRDPAMLCVLAEWDSLLAIESGGFFPGTYLILGGLIAPLDGVAAADLDLDRLRLRLAEGQVQEVVLALGTTLEAENTASFVKNLLAREFPQIRITRLAQGMPLGAEVKYMDKETLRQSLTYRQEF